ncbi:hypothetical protein FRUB_07071 [Fimbriiglobus ruber]|uniref:Uncharacterized protein n=1 Tax=Fimbriiglobus ruber TaxID=1908690 RepID=A0A225D8S1_9BACT|nr:hypothetical protein FRUB_07071 [Fimbriiglobus ruber]
MQPIPGQPAPGGARVPVPGGENPTGALPGGLPGAPPAPAPIQAPVIDPVLRGHLDGWEKAMKGAASFSTECTLERKNLLLKKTTASKGSIWCLKPNMARMRLDAVAPPGAPPNPNNYTAYICTGTSVFEYDGTAKMLKEYKLAANGLGDNLLLEFMSGAITAQVAIARFDLKLLKDDQHYIYIELKSRLPRDKAEFDTMILVLFKPTVPNMGYLPRTVVMRKNNLQEEEAWDFPKPAVNLPGITDKDFKPVAPPKDWKFEQVSVPQAAPGVPTGQPRVARPTQP